MNNQLDIEALLAQNPELLQQLMGGAGQELGPPLPGGEGMPMDMACPPGEVPMDLGAEGADPMQQEALMRALMGQQGPPGPPMR